MRELETRLAKVRHRFAGTLESKIKDNYTTMSQLTGASADAVDRVGETYRRFHEIVALAPPVGFVQTGKAARAAEIILLEAHLAKRGLTATESANLKRALDNLWAAAQGELQSMYARGG